MGSAWIPWVLPIMRVLRCSNALSRSLSKTVPIPSSSRSQASMSCSPVAVSHTSLVVRPRWTHRPSSPRLSVVAWRKAAMSCRVSRRMSSSRSAS